MWNYEKRLEYPIKINPTLAAMIISQYGGPDGELGASMRYISQRYSMPYREVSGLLTDIGVSVVKLHILDLSRCSGSFSFRSLKIFQ